MKPEPESPIPGANWLSRKIVDGYPDPFSKLVKRRLPHLFRLIRQQIPGSLPLSRFAEKDVGVSTLLNDEATKRHLSAFTTELAEATRHSESLRKKPTQKGRASDFSGIYVLISGHRPFYVGITRGVLGRIQAHVRDLEHHSASLFYRLVHSHQKHGGRRAALDLTSSSAAKIQQWLQAQRVAILPLASPVERYSLELYASMLLKTGQWNTFETH